MPYSYGWDGNVKSGVALAIHRRLKWFIHIWAQGDEHPVYTPLRAMEHFTLPCPHPHWFNTVIYLQWWRHISTVHIFTLWQKHSNIREMLRLPFCHQRKHTHTHRHNRLMALCLRLPGWTGTKINIHPFTPVMKVRHPLSTSSSYYDP